MGDAPNQALITAVHAALQAVAVPEDAAPMQAYMKSTLPYYGVKKPARVAAMREVLTAHPLDSAAVWQATIQALFDQATHRESWYAALDLYGHRRYRAWRTPEVVPLLEHLIRGSEWWDIVDDVSAKRLGELLAGHRAVMTPILVGWSADPNLWIRRASILAHLKHKSEMDRETLLLAIDRSLDDPDFFARKAIGWVLREAAKTEPDWVIGVVEDRAARISALSRREALRRLWAAGQALHLKP